MFLTELDTTRHTTTIFFIDSIYFGSDKIGHIDVWERIDFINVSDKEESRVREILYAIDCNRNMIAALEVIKKKLDGTVLRYSKFNPFYSDWQNPTPGSSGELFLQTACKLFMQKK